jgi:teichoic acid transport system permease protein
VTSPTDATAETAATAARDLAAEHDLPKLGGRPSLRSYLAKLWQRRYFTLELARSRFRSANEADRLGAAWIVLLPLINAAVYGAVFGLLLPSSSRPEKNFLGYLVVGVFIFQFFSACLSDGAKSILANRGLVRTLHFPRALLPIASVVQQVFALVPMVGVMCVIVLVTGEPITLRWLELVPALALMVLFCTGVAFFAARMTIHIRDIAQLIPFITRLIFYLSGIFFSVDRVAGKNHTLASALEANPVHVYITLVRDSLLTKDRAVSGVAADARTWEYGIGWAVALFVLGFLFCWQAEELYGRD